jgi:membrane-bound lytic murein transglycosylase D
LIALLGASGCAGFPQNESSETPDSTAVVSEPQAGTRGSAGTKLLASRPPSADQGDQLADIRQYPDLWTRLRAGYALPALDSPLVARHEQWFANNPEYMENMVHRARMYLHHIVEEVEKRGIPMEIALLPAIESAYKPQAYSRARAAGLWQFIPSTGRIYGLRMNWWYDGRRDVLASTQAALDYLEKLRDQFNGDWQLALAAYNCGEGKVERLVAENRRKGLPGDYSSLKKLPRETKNYVPKLMAMVNIIADPAKYGLQLAAIPDTEFFARVETDGQIDLGVVARLTDMPVDELYMINPGYQRWVTDPNGPHELLVPAAKKDALIAGLITLAHAERMQWTRHEVKRGDTISRVAGRYNVTVESIRSVNAMKSNHLSTGQNLLIPVSANKIFAQQPTYVKTAASVHGDGGRIKIVHRVRSGESLWGIARKYKVYIHQLREWNLLETEDALRLGQRLFIWTTHGAGASAAGDVHPPG